MFLRGRITGLHSQSPRASFPISMGFIPSQHEINVAFWSVKRCEFDAAVGLEEDVWWCLCFWTLRQAGS